MNCPSDEAWLAWSARELDANRTAAIASHAVQCSSCQRELALVSAIAAATEGRSAVDVPRVVDGAMARTGRRRPGVAWRPVLAAAAVLALGVVGGMEIQRRGGSEVMARGGGAASWTARVTAEMRTIEAVARPLAEADLVSVRARLALWYRNAETQRPLFLMAYVVDAQGELHWLAPAYRNEGQEPQPCVLPVSLTEALLDDVVELEAPALGPAQVVTVISQAPGSVLRLEGASRAVREAPEVVFPDVAVWRRSITLSP